MNALTAFLKTTLFGGLFILLPLLLFMLLMDELLDVVVALATPIADLFPEDAFEPLDEPLVTGVGLIFVFSLLLGLLARLEPMRRFGLWLEEQTIGRLPLYQAVKSVTSGFASMEEDGRCKPALLTGPNSERDLVFLVEELADGQVVVMLPRAPTPLTGTIKVVPAAQVQTLHVSLGDFTAVISHWGVGTRELIAKAGI